jgi:hypothetical protein
MKSNGNFAQQKTIRKESGQSQSAGRVISKAADVPNSFSHITGIAPVVATGRRSLMPPVCVASLFSGGSGQI